MKRALLIFLALCLMVPVGCRKAPKEEGSDEYEYSFMSEVVIGGQTVITESDKDNTSSNKDNSVSTSEFKPNKNGIDAGDSAGTDKDANYNVKGKVTVAISSYRPTDYEGMFDAMCQVYKNLDIVFDYRPRPTSGGDVNESTQYLTARALAGNMPDVLFDDAGYIWSHVQNGWVEPLDKYVEGDSQFKNVPDNLKADYTYGGKLYALPTLLHFNVTVINTDAAEAMNLKLPKLDWNISDFTRLLKDGTNDVYSGSEYLRDVNLLFPGLYDSGVTLLGYDYRNHNFNKADSTYGKALDLQKELIAIPGLEAYNLRFSSSGSTNDYVAKFGNGDISNMAMAFHLGKTLAEVNYGTWSLDWLAEENNNDFIYWTFPQVSKGRMPYHVSHSFMLKNSQNKEAAFQVLRYITYSTEGNLARLSMYDKANNGKYKLNEKFYYPPTQQKDVAAKFKSLPKVEDIDVYLYENVPNSFRQDPDKLVPEWDNIRDRVRAAVTASDTATVCAQTKQHGNKIVGEIMADFNAKLAKVQAKEK